MDGIKIDVTGNIAKVTEKPRRITSGTIGLPVEFTFDDQWDGLKKVAVFCAGTMKIPDELNGSSSVVPWEVLVHEGYMLRIGVFGANEDGTTAIPTIWTNVSVIQIGAVPDGASPGKPTPPVWQRIENEVYRICEVVDVVNEEYIDINEQVKKVNKGYNDTKTEIEQLGEDVKSTTDRVEKLEESNSSLKSTVDDIDKAIVYSTTESVNKFDGEWDTAVLNSDGTIKESTNYITNANPAKVEPGKYIAVTCQKTATSSIRQTVGIYKYAFYDAESNLVAYAANPTTAVILVPDGSCCVKLSIHKGGGGVSYADLLPMFELLDSDDISTIASAYAEYSDADGVFYYGFVTDKTVNAAQYTIGDGVADDTKGLQKALDIAAENGGGELFIPKGTYKVSGTLFIHENTVVRGSGASTIIQLAPNYSLTKTEWRETSGKWPIVTTDPGKVKTTNESGETIVVDGAGHITVRDIAIYGDETAYHLKSQIGLQIRSNDSLVENVFVKNINYFPKEFPDRTEMGGDNAPGYGIAVMYCDRVNVTGCICNGNGYEGIGTESCNDVVISNCFVGDGNRTGIQVHRGSINVTIANCTVNNTNEHKDADITMHGHVNNPITDVKIIGCTVRGGGDLKGAIELVAGAEHDVVISSCNIESSKSAIYNEGYENFFDRGGSIIVKGNIFKSDNDGLRLYSDYVVCTDNVIDSTATALRTKSKVEPIVANNIFVKNNTHDKVITVAGS